jgi:hypothetical protein
MALGLAVMLALAGGCQVAPKLGADRNDPTPILVDSAMRGRDWPTDPALYPSFSSTVGPAETLFVPATNLSPAVHGFMETPMFFVDSLLTPLAMLYDAPWNEEEGVSFYLPPTYTGNPPLEPVDPKGRQDLSGGPALGWTPANGRAEQVTPQ